MIPITFVSWRFSAICLHGSARSDLPLITRRRLRSSLCHLSVLCSLAWSHCHCFVETVSLLVGQDDDDDRWWLMMMCVCRTTPDRSSQSPRVIHLTSWPHVDPSWPLAVYLLLSYSLLCFIVIVIAIGMKVPDKDTTLVMRTFFSSLRSIRPMSRNEPRTKSHGKSHTVQDFRSLSVYILWAH